MTPFKKLAEVETEIAIARHALRARQDHEARLKRHQQKPIQQDQVEQIPRLEHGHSHQEDIARREFARLVAERRQRQNDDRDQDDQKGQTDAIRLPTSRSVHRSEFGAHIGRIFVHQHGDVDSSQDENADAESDPKTPPKLRRVE